MALLRTASPSDLGPVIQTDRVLLRTPQMTDYPGWAELQGPEPRLPHPVGAALGER